MLMTDDVSTINMHELCVCYWLRCDDSAQCKLAVLIELHAHVVPFQSFSFSCD